MKRAIPLIMMLAVLLTLLIVLAGVLNFPIANGTARVPDDAGGTAAAVRDAAPRTAYTLDVDYNAHTHTARVTQRVDYLNATGVPLNELYFHVYANAYNDEADPPFLPGEMGEAYPRGFEPGGLAFSRITAENGKDGVLERGGTLIRYAFDKPLSGGARAVFNMAYTVTLPYCYGRFGYGERTASLANCFPVAAVYEDGAFRLDPYDKVGDPFYTECADWAVALSLPKGYTAATTGAPEGDAIVARNVRDFCIIISDKFQLFTRAEGGVEVRVYALEDGFGRRSLDAAADAVRVFGERFGAYPYEQLSVVQTDFFIGGMEYPNLVAIDATLGGYGSRDVCEFVVAHEVAHQWWYGVVGSDQLRAPFQDEALTEFSTYLYLEDTKSSGDYLRLLEWMFFPMLDELEARGGGPAIGSPTEAFTDAFTYSAVVYERGAQLFMQLRERVGDDKFFAMLRRYYGDNAYRIAQPKALLDIIRTECSQADALWFEEQLYE